MIILDTNVISELMKLEPAAEVFKWVSRRRGQDLFTTAVNQAEVLFGLAVMPAGRRRETLNDNAGRMFERYFRGRILPFDQDAARPYAEIVARRQKSGKRIDALDAQIAAIAALRNMAVATRDADGFANCGVEVINPWEA